MNQTKLFLDFLFQEHAANFLFRQTYRMTDMFAFAPDFALRYISELETVLNTVPFYFPVLSQKYDDATWLKLTE